MPPWQNPVLLILDLQASAAIVGINVELITVICTAYRTYYIISYSMPQQKYTD